MSEFVLPNFPTDVLQGIGTTDKQYICILKTVMTVWYIFSSTTSIAWLPKRVDHPKQQKTGESEALGLWDIFPCTLGYGEQLGSIKSIWPHFFLRKIEF